METKAPAGPDTVLVVDDERFVRELCVEIIAGEGYRVLAAPDADEALHLARTEPVGTILLDLMLPRTTGFEALEILGREVPDVPVVIMTAHSSQSRVIDLLKLGAYDFLPKPFEPGDLIHATRRALERHHLLTENKRLLRELQDRVRAQTLEINRGQQLLENIISHMGSGLLVTDRDGRIRMINQHGRATLGVTEDQVVGKRLLDLFPAAGPLLGVHAGTILRELDLPSPDGRTLPLGFNNSLLLDAAGQPEGTIIIFRDLSDLRAIRAEARRKDRLAAIGQVAAGVAHEIRNPLFGISSVAQILKTEVKFDPVHQELLAAMQAEIKRLNGLVEDLLDYGRPFKLQRTAQGLEQIWDEILGLAKEELAEAKVQVIRDMGDGLPAVLADGNKLRQVFLNLLVNAAHAIGDGSPDRNEIRLVLACEGRSVVVEVADTGAGIEADRLPHVFDPFFTTKPAGQGTGLGLSIAREIVIDLGGRMSVRSEIGKGSVFRVELPAAAEDPPQPR